MLDVGGVGNKKTNSGSTPRKERFREKRNTGNLSKEISTIKEGDEYPGSGRTAWPKGQGRKGGMRRIRRKRRVPLGSSYFLNEGGRRIWKRVTQA